MQIKNMAALIVVAGLGLSACNSIRDTPSRTTAPATDTVQTQSAERGVIPAGTTFAVRANETISTKSPGKTYPGEVVQTIQDQSGTVLVPNGSPVQLVVFEVSEGGTVGTPNMELGVRSVTVNGRTYNITTAPLREEGDAGLGKNRRTAEMVGGGAALGTLIGAVAGGASGAAVGAAVGAAGGAAAQVLTRGDEVRVPAETVLTFKLDQPWRLEGFGS